MLSTDLTIQDILLTILSVLTSFALILLVVAFGWYLIWKLYLSRFKLIRELLGQFNDPPPIGSSKSDKKSAAVVSSKSRRSTRRD